MLIHPGTRMVKTWQQLHGVEVSPSARSTLRRWMHREHITPHRDLIDGRRPPSNRRSCSLRLARAHSRVLATTKDGEKPPALLAHLCDEVATLAHRLDVLLVRQCRCCLAEQHHEETWPQEGERLYTFSRREPDTALLA